MDKLIKQVTMKESGRMTYHMDMEYMNMVVDMDTKDIGNKVKNMEKGKNTAKGIVT